MKFFQQLKHFWIYLVYALMAASLVLASSQLVSKYLFHDTITPIYAIPVFLSIAIALYLAHNHQSLRMIHTAANPALLTKFIVGGCILTASFNVLHTEWLLKMDVTALSFLVPLVAGALFGYLLARNYLLSQKLMELVTIDPITQIYNRNHFECLINEEIDRVNRYGGKFSLIHFRIDNYQKILKNHGKEFSNRLLAIVTKVVRENNRSPDIFARIESEGFAVLDTQNDLQGAYNHALRLMSAIDYLNLEELGPVSCSFGVTEYLLGKDDVKSLTNAALEAVIRAQEKGKHYIELNDRSKGSPYFKNHNRNRLQTNDEL